MAHRCSGSPNTSCCSPGRSTAKPWHVHSSGLRKNGVSLKTSCLNVGGSTGVKTAKQVLTTVRLGSHASGLENSCPLNTLSKRVRRLNLPWRQTCMRRLRPWKYSWGVLSKLRRRTIRLPLKSRFSKSYGAMLTQRLMGSGAMGAAGYSALASRGTTLSVQSRRPRAKTGKSGQSFSSGSSTPTRWIFSSRSAARTCAFASRPFFTCAARRGRMRFMPSARPKMISTARSNISVRSRSSASCRAQKNRDTTSANCAAARINATSLMLR
mmetsp:Transcript_25181/g.79012  ORF Transcript_25181/g.79012 Transcript_25181/m.79012 type:complete len:268 (+) Transcript_25181:642-1445(+)